MSDNKTKSLSQLDLKEKAAKLEYELQQPVESTGSLYWPKELEDPDYDYRAINNSEDESFEMHSSYKLGWDNLDPEEAVAFRNHMGEGAFSAGSRGEGGIVEIPAGAGVKARIVKRHKQLTAIVEAAYDRKIEKIQRTLGMDLAYESGARMDNRLITNETEVTTGVVR